MSNPQNEKRRKPCRNCGGAKEAGQRNYCFACDNDEVRLTRLAADKKRYKLKAAVLNKAEREGTPLADRKRVWHTDIPPGLRWCSWCKRLQAESRFPPKGRYCRVCAGAKGHATRIKRKYALTAERYAELLAIQEGRCAICRRRPRSMRLAVDHDHSCCPGEDTCGKCVRGLLCRSCNKDLLGTVRDSIETLQAAIDYLREPPAQSAANRAA